MALSAKDKFEKALTEAYEMYEGSAGDRDVAFAFMEAANYAAEALGVKVEV